MQEVYDRAKTTALIQEVRALTAELKSETERIAEQLSLVLDDEDDGEPKKTHPPQAAEYAPRVKRSKWFWR